VFENTKVEKDALQDRFRKRATHCLTFSYTPIMCHCFSLKNAFTETSCKLNLKFSSLLGHKPIAIGFHSIIYN